MYSFKKGDVALRKKNFAPPADLGQIAAATFIAGGRGRGLTPEDGYIYAWKMWCVIIRVYPSINH